MSDRDQIDTDPIPAFDEAPEDTSSIPAGADMPPWAAEILRRYDAGQRANEQRINDVKELVTRRFDGLREEMLGRLADTELRQNAIERRVDTMAITRTTLPIIAVTLSIVALLCWLVFIAMIAYRLGVH